MKESRTWANVIKGCVSRLLIKFIMLVVPSQPPFKDKSTLWRPRPRRSGRPSRPNRASSNLPDLTSVLRECTKGSGMMVLIPAST
jgi:hypothetical protein